VHRSLVVALATLLLLVLAGAVTHADPLPATTMDGPYATPGAYYKKEVLEGLDPSAAGQAVGQAVGEVNGQTELQGPMPKGIRAVRVIFTRFMPAANLSSDMRLAIQTSAGWYFSSSIGADEFNQLTIESLSFAGTTAQPMVALRYTETSGSASMGGRSDEESSTSLVLAGIGKKGPACAQPVQLSYRREDFSTENGGAGGTGPAGLGATYLDRQAEVSASYTLESDGTLTVSPTTIPDDFDEDSEMTMTAEGQTLSLTLP
jgi:hypothetical protein